MAYFPFFVDIEGQDCLIVGGGNVAYRKVMVLADYGPRIRVIAPEMEQELTELKERLGREGKEERLSLICRRFEDKDLEGADFVVAATEDEELNRRISVLCRERKIPVNVVDVQEECSFIFPALVREEDITVGISTGGSSPTIAQYLKARFRKALPEGFGRLAAELGTYRGMVKEQVADISVRTKIFRKMVDEGISRGCRLTEEEAQEIIDRRLEDE